MLENVPSCFRCVGGKNACSKCGLAIIKFGKTKNKKQRFHCKSCNKTTIENYSYNAYRPEINEQIVSLTKEGVGILGTARLLKISATTVLNRIKSIAKNIVQPPISKGKSYEVDEMRTFVKTKARLIWIVYALEKESGKVVSFNVGARTNKTLRTVTESLRLAEAKQIFTDKLRNYKSLIDEKIHKTPNRGTNHIERNNLNIRTHLKRLNRKTICFSKCAVVLSAILRIYFWS